MGSEALSHRSRRDIRRAFAPEASAEVLRFVETMRQDVDLKVATVHNEVLAARQQAATQLELQGVRNEQGRLGSELDAVTRRVDDCVSSIVLISTNLTWRQRLRWLVTGTWQ